MRTGHAGKETREDKTADFPLLQRGVSMTPGAIAFTLIPQGANSRDKDFVKAMMPAFEAE